MPIALRSVLISDAVDDACVALLTSHGVPVTKKYKMSKEELLQEIKHHDGLIVRSDTKVTAEVLAAASSLRVVGRAGTGVDNIDLQAATRKGIVVLNTPGGNSISACEMTCALITSLARNVAQAAQSLRAGRWDRKLYSGHELAGKTLAVLGLGRIGREVAIRMQSYGMRVIGFDPMTSTEAAKEFGVEKMELEQIWPLADYITVHTPLIPQTRNLINATTLAKSKKGVRVINVARGGIVDEEALLDSLKAGHCGGAALDVFVEEPPKNPATLELIQHPNVIGTPHLGASTTEAQQRVAVEIAEQFLAISGRSTAYSVTGIVNAPILTAALSDVNAAWINLSKKLGQLGGKFLKKGSGSISIESQTIGSDMEKKKFVHTAVLVGILAGQTKNGLNLINAPILAKDIGVSIKESHADGENAVAVKVGQHQVKGTVRGANEPLLISIDDAIFSNGVPLVDNLSLYRGSGPGDLASIVTALSAKGVQIQSLNSAGKWFAVQTNQEITVNVDGVENF
ncbi:D-3-phosphoglycerate dehydrogenase [Neodiprion fabricii]|uniref:D-3-phosphoglycerate dehydrogenase n=1 Tax=Neodiprion fabricii TaxID=2872261 RepID=UPI001ED965E8|nr:D-3-phosphoglycerate dehydrogenase [Neodiprion fabricii]